MNLRIKKSTTYYFMAFCYSFLDVMMAWVFELWIPFGLGLAAGGLRVYLFWISDESLRFRKHKVELPEPVRVEEYPAEEEALRAEYDEYRSEAFKQAWWKKPFQLVAVVVAIAVTLYYDKNFIFYTFFLTMMTVWMWHWGWLSKRVGK